jgi:hypothetical protein
MSGIGVKEEAIGNTSPKRKQGRRAASLACASGLWEMPSLSSWKFSGRQ